MNIKQYVYLCLHNDRDAFCNIAYAASAHPNVHHDAPKTHGNINLPVATYLRFI